MYTNDVSPRTLTEQAQQSQNKAKTPQPTPHTPVLEELNNILMTVRETEFDALRTLEIMVGSGNSLSTDAVKQIADPNIHTQLMDLKDATAHVQNMVYEIKMLLGG